MFCSDKKPHDLFRSSSFLIVKEYIIFPCFWDSEGRIHDIGTLGGVHSAAMAISSAGLIVGWSETGDTHPWDGTPIVHAFLWDPQGDDGVPSNPQMKELLGRTGSYFEGWATAISDDSTTDSFYVVGRAGVGDPAPVQAILWHWDADAPGYRAVFLGTLGDLYGDSRADGVNNR